MLVWQRLGVRVGVVGLAGGVLILGKAAIKVKNIGEGKDREGWGPLGGEKDWGH